MTDKSSVNSRRTFLKTSTAAAIGAGVLGQLTPARGAFAGGDDTIRIGLIGCGGRGTAATNEALSTAREGLETRGPVKLVAMADAFGDQLENSLRRNKDRHGDAVAVDDDHKFIGFDAYKQVLASDVDLVILATPPGFRPIHFEAAIAAGKHVFMEKPVAVDAPGVRKVLAAVSKARENDLCVGVGLQRHHQWTYLETMKRIHDGAVGDPVALRVYWNSFGVWDPRRTRAEVTSEMEYQMRNWYYYNWLCGDHICEQHIHNLDVGNWVVGDYPVECHGLGGRQSRTDKKYGEIFDHFAVEYTYANGVKMFSQCRHQKKTFRSVTEHLHGTKGYADISGSRITGPDEWRWPRGQKKNYPYQTEHDDLFAAIRSGTPYNEGENGAMSTLTAIMGRQACYSGQVISRVKMLASDIDLSPAQYAWDADPQSLPNEAGEYAIPVPGVTKGV